MPSLLVAARVLLGVVFAVSAASKTRPADHRAFRRTVRDWTGDRVPAGPAAVTLVVLEAAVPVLLAVRPAAGLALAVVLLAAFTAAIVVQLRRGSAEGCRCFGNTSSPVSPVHVARNAVLLAVALAGLLTGTAASGSSRWDGSAATAGGLALVLAVLVVRLDDLVALLAPSRLTPARPPSPTRPRT